MHIVITGANRGIGHALYRHYVDSGDQVLGTARDAEGFLPLDVSTPEGFPRLAHHLDSQPVDLLICNAGVYLDKHESLATGYEPAMWAQSFAVNVTGVFQTVQTLLPNLQMAENAKIAIISSQMASHTRAPGGSYIYRASKAAALNLGRNLATDLRGLGIAVGIYHPGWVQTDMGGTQAEITVEESATGLAARFAALDLATTGCFQTWDGRDHPY
ncbi:MAG: SDR family NAD(P)-dependent oxidoreductase [Thalassovita mediterranea]|jgi:NAD(P)-dependent dehydrogenase (short-subunit alcohol dehydrogenase family)|uniref:SDR family NAD(P)-dependent oxidoreductase n=1 Tax=Thalassovita mediterranea TaxID=340021 RepID=UPI003C3F4EED|nr:SDR family NAD(P)-dependent oxidoreductase [Phaeobacter sp. CNT1-3]